MAPDQFQREIQRFLLSKKPEVLCITGRWGTGKTFAWNRYLDDAERSGQIGLSRYSYVSLFGIESLPELRNSLFDSVRPCTNPTGAWVRQYGLATSRLRPQFVDQLDSLLTNFNRLILHAAGIPKVTAFIGDVRPTMVKFVTDAVVCIDDLERRGEKLAIRDVMGLVSQLKEDRRCKVVIILNIDALSTEDRKGFDHYFEKVIDVRLPFDPSPDKAVEIALPAEEVDGRLSHWCRQLGVKNIRVIRKIRASCDRLRAILEGFGPRVHESAVHTVCVLGWIVYDRDSAPSIDFIRSKVGPIARGLTEKELSPDEERWDQLLNSCSFTDMDEFDRAVLEWLLSGHLDAQPIRQTASIVANRLEQQHANEVFSQAWSLYHDSFDDNAQEFGAGVRDSFIGTIKYRSLNDLNGVVWALKEIGWEVDAKELIRNYLDLRPDAVKAFRESVFGQDINDPDVLSMLREHLESEDNRFDPAATLLAVAKSSSYSPDSVAKLAELSPDEYYRIFRPATAEARKCIRAALRIVGSPSGEPERMRIYLSARAALVRIGRECPLNRVRVTRKYEIDIDADLPTSIAAAEPSA